MDTVKLLQDLVRIPSVNPDNTPATNKVGEQKIADYLQPILEDLGYNVFQEEIFAGRPNLIARAPGSSNRPRILLCPHLDTVGVENMTINPFSGEIKDSKIWGRGSSDTKGSIAAMIAGIARNKDILSTLPVAVDFVAFMGEESSQHGSKHFAQKYAADYQFAIAGEPTMLDIVYTTKGSLWFTLESKGKAAHSSQPQLGQNAITMMARSLALMNDKLSSRLATYSHPVLGHSTLNIGTISGGSRPNIVPDHCTAEIDIRTTPNLESSETALALVESFIRENKLPVTLTHAHNNPPMECPQDHHFISTIKQTRPEAKLVGAPWFSDAAHLSLAEIPSICMGPGSIDQAHTKDEFIDIEQLEKGAQFFADLIANLTAE